MNQNLTPLNMKMKNIFSKFNSYSSFLQFNSVLFKGRLSFVFTAILQIVFHHFRKSHHLGSVTSGLESPVHTCLQTNQHHKTFCSAYYMPSGGSSIKQRPAAGCQILSFYLWTWLSSAVLLK